MRVKVGSGDQPDASRDYVVVLEASSAVRFDDGASVTLRGVPTKSGPVTATWFTRHSPEGFDVVVPRELFIQIEGTAGTLDDAREVFVEVGRVLTPYVAFVGNAAIDDPKLLVAFDATPGANSRDFLQGLRPTEVGMFRPSRRLDPQLVGEVVNPILGHGEAERLHRAVVHYGEALKAWLPGSDLRVLNHLWMAVEALTKAALRGELARRGDDRDALLADWEMELKQLDGEVRRRLIFHGDKDAYDTARDASDAIEHSFEDFAAVHPDAARIRDSLAGHVRAAILEIAGVDLDVFERATASPYDRPRESFPLSRFIRGKLVGEGDILAASGNPYPWLDWEETIENVALNSDGSFRVTQKPTMTARLAEGIAFTEVHYEVWGPRQDPAPFSNGLAREEADDGAGAET